jgi:hypothetical protein
MVAWHVSYHINFTLLVILNKSNWSLYSKPYIN